MRRLLSIEVIRFAASPEAMPGLRIASSNGYFPHWAAEVLAAADVALG
jgi:hypothetical protein